MRLFRDGSKTLRNKTMIRVISAERLSEMAQSTSVLAIDGKVLDITAYMDER